VALTPVAACLPRATGPSADPAQPPPVLVEATTPGLRRPESRDLLRALGLRAGQPLDTAALRRGLIKLAESDRFRAVWLDPDSAAPRDSVRFTLRTERRPGRVAGLGLAYDNELGARMWLGGVDRHLFDRAVEASAALFLGGLQDQLVLGIRRTWRERAAPRPTLTLTLTDDRIQAFDPAGGEVAKLDARTGTGFAGLETSLGSSWLVRTGFEGMIWEDPTATGQRTGGVVLEVLRNDPQSDARLTLSGEWTGNWRRVSFEWAQPIRWGAVTVTPGVRAALADSLPLQLTYPLGGDDGFPGLHVFELRGTHEAYGSLAVAVPLVGPLQVLAQGAAGTVATSTAGLTLDDWRVGGRIGLGATTPFGPVRLEYGATRGFRDQVFFRVGRWF
jgi:hypothetical protein